MTTSIATTKLTDTVNLFWTPQALKEFQTAWDAQAPNPDDQSFPEWQHWLWRIGTAPDFPSLSSLHWKTEQAINNDIEKLYAAARTGCNLTLTRVYYQLWSKWSERNDAAADYLANAWNCISTAQCMLAKQWGAFIDWHVEDVAEA